jgi:hypothetical protein
MESGLCTLETGLTKAQVRACRREVYKMYAETMHVVMRLGKQEDLMKVGCVYKGVRMLHLATNVPHPTDPAHNGKATCNRIIATEDVHAGDDAGACLMLVGLARVLLVLALVLVPMLVLALVLVPMLVLVLVLILVLMLVPVLVLVLALALVLVLVLGLVRTRTRTRTRTRMRMRMRNANANANTNILAFAC